MYSRGNCCAQFIERTVESEDSPGESLSSVKSTVCNRLSNYFVSPEIARRDHIF